MFGLEPMSEPRASRADSQETEGSHLPSKGSPASETLGAISRMRAAMSRVAFGIGFLGRFTSVTLVGEL
jgi:hypothetical protein